MQPHRYKELLELAKLRKQRLLDALSLYKLFSEADGVEQWIGEKVRTKQQLYNLPHMELLPMLLLPLAHGCVPMLLMPEQLYISDYRIVCWRP